MISLSLHPKICLSAFPNQNGMTMLFSWRTWSWVGLLTWTSFQFWVLLWFLFLVCLPPSCHLSSHYFVIHPTWSLFSWVLDGVGVEPRVGVDKCEWVPGTSMIPYLEVSGSQEGDPSLEWKNLSPLYRSSSLGAYLGLAHQLSWWTVGQKGSESVGEIGSWDGGGWFCFEACQSCSAQEAWVWDSCNCLIFLIELVACWQSIQMQKKIFFKLGRGTPLDVKKQKTKIHLCFAPSCDT